MMNGQWLGRYQGSNSGKVLIEIDDVGDHYEGQAFVYDDERLPHTFARIITKDKSDRFEECIPVHPIHPKTGDPATWDQIKGLFPDGTTFPREAHLNLDRPAAEIARRDELRLASGDARVQKRKVCPKAD